MVATGAAGYLTILRSRVRGAASFCDRVGGGTDVACLGGRGSPVAGLNVDLRQSRGFYAELAPCPKDAMIAGWPIGVVDNIPYVAQRQVLVNLECHGASCGVRARDAPSYRSDEITAYFANSGLA